MHKKIITITWLALSVVGLAYMVGACRKTSVPSTQARQQVIPEGFPQPEYTFADNPLTDQGFELGRKLFYDGRLSVDNSTPCSSCHQQIAGFGTFEHDRSHGVNNTHTLRNAPVLFNLAWQTSFHWDSAFTSLKDESVHPITGQTEMGETMERVIAKLRADSTYRRLFREAFHSFDILPVHVQKALAQFTGYLTSAHSRYDRYKQGTAAFTAQEEQGYQLFKTHCASCHPEPLFTDHSYRNIGLPVDHHLEDYGKMRVTGKAEDSLKFKVPTLRNVYISSNYMHDGRFNTLSQVLNHYRSGVQPGPTLDPGLENGITLSDAEANNIALFLRTLTDSSFLLNPAFGDPD